MSEGLCCACRQTTTVYTLRKGVTKCAKCVCDQIGKPAMDLLRKGIANIPPPVNVLIAVSGGPSSMFAYHIFTNRINTKYSGKGAVIKRIEAVSTKDLPIDGLHHIDVFTVPTVVKFAQENGFNCVVLGDNTDTIALKSLAIISRGRPDLFKWISSNDEDNYKPITIVRPIRQALKQETAFYCKEHNIDIIDKPSPILQAFGPEAHMLECITKEGNEATPFAIQKMSEKMPAPELPEKCPMCGLPAPDCTKPCALCEAIEKYL